MTVYRLAARVSAVALALAAVAAAAQSTDPLAAKLPRNRLAVKSLWKSPTVAFDCI